MKKFALLALTLIAATRLQAAVEPLSSEDLAKATELLAAATKGMEGLALKPELDPANAQGFKAEGGGVIVIPDKNLSADKAAMKEEAKKAGKGGTIPAGELWMLSMVPKKDGSVVASDKLRHIKITVKDKEMELTMYRLGITRDEKKEFSLVLYGKDSSPLLTLPLQMSTDGGSAKISVTGRRDGEDSGMVTLNIAGRFKAELPVGPAN